MNNSYTKVSVGALIDYANGERALVMEDSIASQVTNSTAIDYWSYNPSTKTLTVQYAGSPKYYYYGGIPFHVVFGLMNADSLGQFIATEIKPNYELVV